MRYIRKKKRSCRDDLQTESIFNEIDTRRVNYHDVASSLIDEVKMCTQLDAVLKHTDILYKDGVGKHLRADYIRDFGYDQSVVDSFTDDVKAVKNLSRNSYLRLREIYVLLDNPNIANHVSSYAEFQKKLDKDSLKRSGKQLSKFKSDLNSDPNLSVSDTRGALTEHMLAKLHDYYEKGGDINLLKEAVTFTSSFDSDSCALHGVVNKRDSKNPHAQAYAQVWKRLHHVFKCCDLDTSDIGEQLEQAVEPKSKYNETIYNDSKTVVDKMLPNNLDRIRYYASRNTLEFKDLFDNCMLDSGKRLPAAERAAKLNIYNDLQRDLINTKSEQEDLKIKRGQVSRNLLIAEYGAVLGDGCLRIQDFEEIFKNFQEQQMLTNQIDNHKREERSIRDQGISEGFFEEFATTPHLRITQGAQGVYAFMSLINRYRSKELPIDTLTASINEDYALES